MSASRQLVDEARARAECWEIHVERVEDLAAKVLLDWIHHNGKPLSTTWADFPPKVRSRIITDRARHAHSNYEKLVPLCRSQLEIDILRGLVNAAIRKLHPDVFA